jgi:hypothetical protein
LCAGVTSRGAIVAMVPRKSFDRSAMRGLCRSAKNLDVSDDTKCQSPWTRCSNIYGKESKTEVDCVIQT